MFDCMQGGGGAAVRSMRPLSGALALVVLAACATSKGPAAPAPAAEPYVVPEAALPTAQDLEGAPNCVRAMARTRTCFADQTKNGGKRTCPPGQPKALQRTDLGLGGKADVIPYQLERAWNDLLKCNVVLKRAELSEGERATLNGLGFPNRVGDQQHTVLSGQVKLSHLFCLYEVEIVKLVECEMPPPVVGGDAQTRLDLHRDVTVFFLSRSPLG